MSISIKEYNWSAQQPKSTGLWEVKCLEGGYKAERVAIIRHDTGLAVHEEHLGQTPIAAFHDGITDVTWRKIA